MASTLSGIYRKEQNRPASALERSLSRKKSSWASRHTRQRLPLTQGSRPSLHQRQIVLSFTLSSLATSSAPSRSILCSLAGVVVNLDPLPAPV